MELHLRNYQINWLFRNYSSRLARALSTTSAYRARAVDYKETAAKN